MLRLAAASASALLLALAYPPAASADLAFFALVPVLLALRTAAPRSGFKIGFCFGFLFRLANLSWLLALKNCGGPLLLVAAGWLALSAYTALFAALWGWMVASLWGLSRRQGLRALLLLRAVAWICEPLLWAGSEQLVTNLLTGFPWNPLAATQVANMPLLSICSIGGATMLSALLVCVNGGIASFCARIWSDAIAPRFAITPGTVSSSDAATPPTRKPRVPRSLPLAFALVLVVASWWNGIDRVRAANLMQRTIPHFRIVLVHPDAACIFERNDEAVEEANESLLSFTALASATGPDLVIWPETALPGFVPYDKDSFRLVSEACKVSGAPLFAGGVECVIQGTSAQWETSSLKEPREYLLFNSGLLFENPPKIAALYRKRHLVPFGEYIPLESKIPALKRLAPTGFSCEAGLSPAIFWIANASAGTNTTDAAFSPLICFEDAFPYLAREAAESGACALVSIANDSWFDGTCEPEQHLSQSILRAVETGLPVMRATNRGVSAFIMPNGRVIRRLGSGRGGGSPGFITADVGISASPEKTIYTKHGDAIFATPCAGLLSGLILLKLVAMAKRHGLRRRKT